MTQSAIALSVVAVLLGIAAGPKSRFQELAWRSAWGCVAAVGTCLMADLMT